MSTTRLYLVSQRAAHPKAPVTTTHTIAHNRDDALRMYFAHRFAYTPTYLGMEDGPGKWRMYRGANSSTLCINVRQMRTQPDTSKGSS